MHLGRTVIEAHFFSVAARRAARRVGCMLSSARGCVKLLIQPKQLFSLFQPIQNVPVEPRRSSQIRKRPAEVTGPTTEVQLVPKVEGVSSRESGKFTPQNGIAQ